MDVAKYIGLFLLKNNFVYIHGLGNLELRKRRASYNGEALQGGGYEVAMTPTGSIDDNLANFIATNEQISISKASNALREFSMAARADLASGKTVDIPAIGKFEQERGKIIFTANPVIDFTPPAIPSVRIARRQSDTLYQPSIELPKAPVAQDASLETPVEDSRGSEFPWTRVAIAVGALLFGALAVYLVWQYMGTRDSGEKGPMMQALPSDSVNRVTQVTDPDTSTISPSAASNDQLSFDVVLRDTTSFIAAERRLKKLQGSGLNVRLVAAADSSRFFVLLPVENVSPADTARMLDSIRRMYNPRGVSIYQP